MKFLYIAIVLVLQILHVMPCGPNVLRNSGVCCVQRSIHKNNNCCCFDANEKLVQVNKLSGFPPRNIIVTAGLDCKGCKIGLMC